MYFDCSPYDGICFFLQNQFGHGEGSPFILPCCIASTNDKLCDYTASIFVYLRVLRGSLSYITE